MLIGEQLKKIREEHLLSQENLAEILDVSRQTISNWENTKSYPDIERVMRMSEIYHLSLDELLKGDTKMVQSWLDATDSKRTVKQLVVLLLINLLALIGLLIFNQNIWVAVSLMAILAICVVSCFYLLIKLI